jgi:hypothetical protein
MNTEKAEYVKHYDRLRQRARDGDIADLVADPKFPIVVNGVNVCVIEAAFSYRLVQRGTRVAEFVNAPNSGAHAVKKNLLKACHGVESTEVRL